MIKMYVASFHPHLLQRKVIIKTCTYTLDSWSTQFDGCTVEQDIKCVSVTSGSSTVITDLMSTHTVGDTTAVSMELHSIVQCISTSSSSSTLTTTTSTSNCSEANTTEQNFVAIQSGLST